VIVLRLKSVEEMCLSPTETRTHVSHISGSVALMAQYLNVRQRKLGTIIIQTVHILQHDNADTGSLPVEDFVKHSPTYFQIIQPGSSTVTPPYQWRRRRHGFESQWGNGTFPLLTLISTQSLQLSSTAKPASSLLQETSTTQTPSKIMYVQCTRSYTTV
jgi:hypothetical protein